MSKRETVILLFSYKKSNRIFMSYQIETTLVEKSRLPEVDFNNLPFGKTFSDHMFVADYKDGKWQQPRIVPFGNFSIHPAAMALHYGQAIFEGMKASVDHQGHPMFMRPEKHVERLNASARRLVMPEVPADLFLQAIHKLVDLDAAWIPPTKGSALYLRPYMFATDEFIGVKPSQSYKFIIFTGPVGPYYPKPVSLYADTTYIRAAQGGTGFAKCAGNYAGSLLPARNAMEKGYDQVLWLDAKEHKYIQEVGTMNIFFQIGDTIVTPDIKQDTILQGITRNCCLTFLRDNGYKVEERAIDIHELEEAYDKGELKAAFGTGTAAVVAHVHQIAHNGKEMNIKHSQADSPGQKFKDFIEALRAGEIEDKYNWIVPVNSTAKATL